MEAMRGSQGNDHVRGGRPPEMTDDMAAEIGTNMQTKNDALFKALDTDSDGTLTAKELKTGMEAMRPAKQETQSNGETDATTGNISTQWSGYRQNMMADLLNEIFSSSKS
jgi:hypothetical protein